MAVTQIPTYRNLNYRMSHRIQRLKRQIAFDRLVILSMLAALIVKHWLVYLLFGAALVIFSLVILHLVKELRTSIDYNNLSTIAHHERAINSYRKGAKNA